MLRWIRQKIYVFAETIGLVPRYVFEPSEIVRFVRRTYRDGYDGVSLADDLVASPILRGFHRLGGIHCRRQQQILGVSEIKAILDRHHHRRVKKT
jgi:hypothetical protein